MKLTFAVTEPVIDLPDNLLREIGETTILFANLEWRLTRFAYAVIGVDRNLGRIAVREPRAYERFDMICDLLAYKGAASNADLSGIRKRIVECDEMRNILAHSTWVRDPIHDSFRLVKTTGQWQPTPSHPPKTKRKVHPEAVLFEAPEAVALNDKLRLLLKEIEQWAAEFQLPLGIAINTS